MQQHKLTLKTIKKKDKNNSMKIKTTLLLLALILATAVSAQTPDYATLKASLSKKSLPLVNITVEIGNVSKPNYLPAKIEIADP